MLKNLLPDLQLFADGGDGGAAGNGTVSGETTGEELPSAIPERAKESYRKAVAKHTPSRTVQDVTDGQSVEQASGADGKKSYADLINSEDYKEEHRAYMEKTIGERLKKYKGMEEQNSQMLSILETVAAKYGMDTADGNFLADLERKIGEDNSYYETYASAHDITPEEAKRVIALERRLQEAEAREQEMKRQEAARQQMIVLQQNAERTKARFPGFDLDAEMQDERFRRLCAVNHGDTTAAYMACHWEEVVPGMVRSASQQISAQTAQAVAANKARPVENGVSGTAAAVSTQEDFRNMSLSQLREYAAEQRRKTQGR